MKLESSPPQTLEIFDLSKRNNLTPTVRGTWVWVPSGARPDKSGSLSPSHPFPKQFVSTPLPASVLVTSCRAPRVKSTFAGSTSGPSWQSALNSFHFSRYFRASPPPTYYITPVTGFLNSASPPNSSKVVFFPLTSTRSRRFFPSRLVNRRYLDASLFVIAVRDDHPVRGTFDFHPVAASSSPPPKIRDVLFEVQARHTQLCFCPCDLVVLPRKESPVMVAGSIESGISCREPLLIRTVWGWGWACRRLRAVHTVPQRNVSAPLLGSTCPPIPSTTFLRPACYLASSTKHH